MAKKKVKKSGGKSVKPSNLPTNIIQVGSTDDLSKRIYIHQNVYKQIKKFAHDKLTVESGGFLIGEAIEEMGKTYIVVSGFIEAKYSEGTPTTLTFTHDTWDYVNNTLTAKFKKKRIVGWIHTHPDFGVFLSEYDLFIQDNFFGEDYEIAYVIDPIRSEEGFYVRENGKTEKTSCFYIYDENGKKIKVDTSTRADIERKQLRKYRYATIGLAVLTIILAIALAVTLLENRKLSDSVKKYSEAFPFFERGDYQIIIEEIPSGDGAAENSGT